MITKAVKLWLGNGPRVVIPVSQFDTMWQFVFGIIKDGLEWTIPTGASAVLNGLKPDGNVFAFSGTISGNTVTVNCDVQMTAVAGDTICELSILANGKTVGTANFTLMVEAAPKSPDDVSSDSTLPAYEELLNTAAHIPADIPGYVSDWLDDHITQPTNLALDDTLTVSGAAADSKAVGDKIASIGSMTTGAKNALLALLEKVCFANDDEGRDLLDALEDELFPPANLVSITATFTQGSAVIYDTDSLDDLRQYLVVQATYDDLTVEPVTTYTLSGTLTTGTSTITASYGGKTDTFTVTVTHETVDTTAQIAKEDYMLAHRNSSPEYYDQAKTNCGITIKYTMGEATTILYPAGIIPTDAKSTMVMSPSGTAASLVVYDSNDNPVGFVNELTSSSFNRWVQAAAGTMTEFSQSWTSATAYTKIAFTVDMRYVDDAYMYDKTTGQVWFAGINTPYYGMSNISEAGGE